MSAACPRCGGDGRFLADVQFPVCPPERNDDETWACNFCRGTGEVEEAGHWSGLFVAPDGHGTPTVWRGVGVKPEPVDPVDAVVELLTPRPYLPGPASSLPVPGGESVVLAGGAPRQGGADEGGAA